MKKKIAIGLCLCLTVSTMHSMFKKDKKSKKTEHSQKKNTEEEGKPWKLFSWLINKNGIQTDDENSFLLFQDVVDQEPLNPSLYVFSIAKAMGFEQKEFFELLVPYSECTIEDFIRSKNKQYEELKLSISDQHADLNSIIFDKIFENDAYLQRAIHNLSNYPTLRGGHFTPIRSQILEKLKNKKENAKNRMKRTGYSLAASFLLSANCCIGCYMGFKQFSSENGNRLLGTFSTTVGVCGLSFTIFAIGRKIIQEFNILHKLEFYKSLQKTYNASLLRLNETEEHIIKNY